MPKVLLFSLFLLAYQQNAICDVAKIAIPTHGEVANRTERSFDEQTDLHQLYNTSSFPSTVSEELRNKIEIDLYLVPEEHINKYEISTASGDPIVNFFKVKIRGRSYIRFSRHPDNAELKRWLDKNYQKDKVHLHATYMVSGRTFFCWGEDIPAPFFLKLDGMPMVYKSRTLGASDIYSSVLTTEIFLNESFNFLPEPFGASIKKNNSGFQLRLFSPNNPISPSSAMIPAHTFFNPIFFNKLIRTSPASKPQIISSLINVFAEFIVKSFFEAGAGLAAHTQNTWIVYNRNTGLVEDIVYQDLGDILFDDSIRDLNGKKSIGKIPLKYKNSLAVVDRDLLEGRSSLQAVFNNYALQFLDELETLKVNSFERFLKVLETKIKGRFMTGRNVHLEADSPFRAVDEIARLLTTENIRLKNSGESCKSIFQK